MRDFSDIELRLLRVFIGVVQAGGMSAAQATLNIALSTISAHVATLEERLGVRLCARGRAGFRLTEAGQVVYEEANRVFSALGSFRSVTDSLGGKLSGSLNVGTVDTTVTNRSVSLAEVMRRFNQRTSEVHINLVIGARHELEHAVVEGGLHLAIGPFAKNHVGLKYQPLYTETQEVYCGRHHPLFKLRPAAITPRHLAASAVAVRGIWHGHDLDRIGSRILGATVQHLEAMLVLLLSGGYIGYLPAHYAATWVKRAELKPIRVSGLSYRSRFGFITRRGAALTQPAVAFIEDLKQIISAAPESESMVS